MQVYANDFKKVRWHYCERIVRNAFDKLVSKLFLITTVKE